MQTEESRITTDVLVVGGGMAGCFAAINAKEKGAEVILVEKGYVSRSGQSPFARGIMVFNPEMGHKLDTWVEFVSAVGEYINNRDWTEAVIKDSHLRYQDLVSWGAKFPKGGGVPSGPPSPLGDNPTLSLGADTLDVLRKQIIKSGVKIIDRIMVTDLIKREDKITGATGISTDSNELYIFKAKSVILCTGAAGFKPPGWPISNLTADGHAMAYRAGAEISGKEFLDTHFTGVVNPALRGMGRSPKPAETADKKKEHPRPERGMVFENAEGNEISGDGLPVGLERYLALEHEAHAGRAPVYMRGNPVVGGTASGMSVHTTEGIWPINTHCASSIPGLYAAGDSCSTMQSGAVYTIAGSALMTAAVTGARAGSAAAEYASDTETSPLDENELERLKATIYEPFKRKGGFSPRWVTQQLQNLMIPYHVMYIKHEERMKATLTLVEFMRDHLVSKLIAKDHHELRLAIETRNMVLNAEMRLRAGMARKESRGCHFREDYPYRNDHNFLAWVLLKVENRKMSTFKREVPEEWRPDHSKPYPKLYPCRFPGELDFLRKQSAG